MTAQPAARLTVSRRSPADVQTRQVLVSLDGTQVATLMYGDTSAAGPHYMTVTRIGD